MGSMATDYQAALARPATLAEGPLVAAVQQGDVEAFRTFHRHFAVDLLEFTHSYLRSRHDAEEVVQELFLWIWEHRHEWEPRGSLRAYLFKAARNRSLNRIGERHVQERFRERLAQVPRHPAQSEDPLSRTTTRELARVLADAIEQLPPRCREVFRLVREQRLSYAQTAILIGISAKTVEMHMNRALAVLRRRAADWRQ
jgi:RNA polymerase sigma-70 factor (ECF subfamily)